jgi:UvrD-like helicase C-terminal domain
MLSVFAPARLPARSLDFASADAMPFKTLEDDVKITFGKASISTMHLAKGLEFRAVAVIACDDEVIPLQERIQTVADGADLKDVYNTDVTCFTSHAHVPETTSLSPAYACTPWHPT